MKNSTTNGDYWTKKTESQGSFDSKFLSFVPALHNYKKNFSKMYF